MYRTEKDTSIKAFGRDITLFGKTADVNISVGRSDNPQRCSTRTHTGRCPRKSNFYVKRARIIDVNADARQRYFDSPWTWDKGPPPRSEGLVWDAWYGCIFHIVDTIDFAFAPQTPRKRRSRLA